MALTWRDRRVLVTGAAGFVGANLCAALIDQGADVVGLDLVKSSPSLRVLGLGGLPMITRNLKDAYRIESALSNGNGELEWRRPEVVFHLGGMGHIKECQERPLEAWEANVQGTWNLLEACRKLPAGQIKAVVVASSNHVFGSRRAAWHDDDSCGQTDVYGTSKGCMDLLTKAYGAMGLPVAALRHVNCFGPADPHRSHIVTGMICDLLEGKAPAIRGDGTPVKGYLHVEDVCRAYLMMAEALVNGRLEPGRALNAGGDPIPVLSLVDTLIQVAGIDIVPVILREDLSQSGYIEVLNSNGLDGLGWRAGPFREGLWQAWAWYKEHGGMAWLSG